MLLKDLYSLTDMNKNRVDRLLSHHKRAVGADVTDIMCISAWHAISKRKTGGRYVFRGEKLTYTEISSRIPLGVRAITERIKSADIQFGEDVSHLFAEIADITPTERESLTNQVADLIRSQGMHPFEAWTIAKGRPLEFLADALGVHLEHLYYHVFKTSNSSSKTLSKVSTALEVSQTAMRASFEAYKQQISANHKRYCEVIADRLTCNRELLQELPGQISRELCQGKLPVSIIKGYLGLSNEDVAAKMGLSTQAFIMLKTTIRPQKKTIESLSEVSGIGTEVLYKVFAICRQAKQEALEIANCAQSE